MTKARRVFAGAALILPLALAGLAQAQAYGPPPPPGDAFTSESYGPPPGPPKPSDTARNLRKQLQLRPDQEGALNAFVQSVAPPPDMEARMRREQDQARDLTTPERLDLMVSDMDEMRQVMLARVQATKAFYRQLSPEQQRAFDRIGGPNDAGGHGGYRPEPPGGPNAPPSQGGFQHG